MLECLRPLEHAYGQIGTPEKIRLYADKLAGFSHAALEKAVDRVLETHRTSRFPAIADIIAACKETSEGRVSNPEGEAFLQSLRKRDEKLNKLAADAGRAACRGTLGADAIREQWDHRLFAYVMNATRLYEQFRNEWAPGYDVDALCNSLWLSATGRHTERAEREQRYVARIRERAKRGEEMGGIPSELIAEWKDEAVKTDAYIAKSKGAA